MFTRTVLLFSIYHCGYYYSQNVEYQTISTCLSHSYRHTEQYVVVLVNLTVVGRPHNNHSDGWRCRSVLA
jgi:hypothetical protein